MDECRVVGIKGKTLKEVAKRLEDEINHYLQLGGKPIGVGTIIKDGTTTGAFVAFYRNSEVTPADPPEGLVAARADDM